MKYSANKIYLIDRWEAVNNANHTRTWSSLIVIKDKYWNNNIKYNSFFDKYFRKQNKKQKNKKNNSMTSRLPPLTPTKASPRYPSDVSPNRTPGRSSAQRPGLAESERLSGSKYG